MTGEQGNDSLAQGAARLAWDFAVQAYGRPGAREAALALQDRRGVDVVALLVLLHRAARGGGSLSPDRLAEALARVAPWRAQAILPLRRVRRALKSWRFGAAAADPRAEAVRAKVAEAELKAERVELEQLALALAPGDGPPGDPGAAGAALVALYFKVAAIEADARDRRDLSTLLAAAIPAAADHAARLVDGAFAT